jgi:cytosine deaminase
VASFDADLANYQPTSPVTSANDAADRVRAQAEAAADVSCYGIGGMIVENNTGRIIRAWGNRAQGQLKSGEYYPLDPSNHGETQLVRWYFENQDTIRNELGYLPAPNQLTVVTSLDPCAMCAGGLCAAGFNVAVVAPDVSSGGVNWDSSGQFTHMPEPIRLQLQSLFGYYAVDSVNYRSTYQGNPNLLFNTQSLTEQVFQANLDAFENSSENVRKVRTEARISTNDIQDPLTLDSSDPTIQKLRARFPEALSLKLTEKVDITSTGISGEELVYYRPSDELHNLLRAAVAGEVGAENAVAMIDKFGNLLAIGVDKPLQGPIKTALFNAVSDYSRFAFELISEASDASVPFAFKNSTAYRYLSPARNVTYIYLKAPSGGRAQTLKDIGLFGSTSRDIIQYIEPPVVGTKLDFERSVRSAPLYYLKSVNLTPLQTTPSALNIVVSNANDSGEGSLRAALENANASNSYRSITISNIAPIELKSDLPIVNVPVDIIGGASGARSLIDFNGFAGLRFSNLASGSTVQGLWLIDAKEYGLESSTSHLHLADLQFGDSNNQSTLNRLGSIKDPKQFIGSNLGGWSNDLAALNPKFQINMRSLEINASKSLVTTFRLDNESELMQLRFRDVGNAANSQPFVTLNPSSGKTLSAEQIESSFQNQSSLQADLGVFGGQFTQSLAKGMWLPEVQLADGTPLTLTWLEQSGNVINGEFKLLMETAGSDPVKSQLLGKTYALSWILPNSGQNTRSQQGELGIRYLLNGPISFQFGFYEVEDPVTGMVTGKTAEDTGYGVAAFMRAQESSLLLGNSFLNHRNRRRRPVGLNQMDPAKSYGLILVDEQGIIHTSYDQPIEGRKYPFMGHLLSNNRIAVSIESDPSTRNVDYADLTMTIPDNVGMIGGAWV